MKKPVKNPVKNKEKKPRRNFFSDQRVGFVCGILLLVFTLYLGIAFISFIFSGEADQSKLDLSWGQLIFSSDVKVENKAGKSGAWLAEVIVNRGFGYPSFLFLYIFILLGLRMLGRKTQGMGKKIVFSILFMVWFSVALGFFFTKTDASSFVYPGGRYGFVISNWLRSLTGSAGTVLILLFTLFILIATSIKSLVPWMIEKFREREKIRKEKRALRDMRAREVDLDFDDDIIVKKKSKPAAVSVDTEISKIIEEGDVVKAVFDPDTAHDSKNDDLGIEVEVARTHHETPVRNGHEEQGEDSFDGMEVEQNEDEFLEAGSLPDYDPTLELSSYKYPTLELLGDYQADNAEVSNDELISNKNKIVETLRHYKIEITKIRATIGPTITLYEIVPAPGIRIAKIKNLEDDIALSLAALGIRIIAPIPGRGTIGIEVPNQNPKVVSMKSILGSAKFIESKAELPVAVGKTISNETYMFDLAKMPHILVAGATGQGKSVGLNVIIASLLYKKHPSELKFVFIDPKKVELNLYAIIEKHFLAKLPNEEEPIITDIQKVKNTLASLTVEMDLRYDLLKKAHARNIKEYNEKFIKRRLNPEKGHHYMPYIVVIIDEFADLIMTAGKEVELPIARIAQLARAIGIHMIIATQRPSINIITGVIKANFPARIAFKVASMIDSRTILDTPGANQLIGKGDMLVSSGGITRVQCAFLDTPEVESICNFIAEQRGFPTAFYLPEVQTEDGGLPETDLSNKDELFEDAARLVVLNQMGSTSMIQRKLSLGYNRAGRIMDQLEVAGIVGPSEGSKARQVLIQDEYTLEQLLNNL